MRHSALDALKSPQHILEVLPETCSMFVPPVRLSTPSVLGIDCASGISKGGQEIGI